MDYIKFYSLENYLFNEVRTNFSRRGFLSPEEFFCIVIWKANRAKTAIKKRVLKFDKRLDVAVKKLTREIYLTRTKEEKLGILLKKWKFRLPMASAILAVLYPDDFTVYDVRVRNQFNIDDFSDRKNQIEKYFSEFLPKVRNSSGKNLREKDMRLWGKSFYTDLQKFIVQET